MEKRPGLHPIFESPSVRLTLWRCPRHREPNRPTPERSHPSPTFVFLHSGNTVVHSREPRGLLDCTRVAFFNSDVPYHSTHPFGGGDHGSELAMRPEIAAEILGRYDSRSRQHPESPFTTGSGPCPPEAFLLERVLVRKVTARDGADQLEVDELALTIAEMLARAASGGGRRPVRENPGSARIEREESEQLRGILSSRPGARHTLGRLSAHLDSSPFRLCRVFRASTGTTIHRYLTQLRLLSALDRLADGCRDLTGLAFDLGFSSHSHFTSTFRKNFGVTPDSVRTITRAGKLGVLRRRFSPTSAAASN